jgi:ABC-2 type transport system ATP-binding protein
VADGEAGDLEVSGLTEQRVGDIAFAHGVRLHHLAPSRASLEQAFMELTADSVEYHAGLPETRQPAHIGPAHIGMEN